MPAPRPAATCAWSVLGPPNPARMDEVDHFPDYDRYDLEN